MNTKIACLLQANDYRSTMVAEGFKKCLYDNQIPYHENMLISSSSKEILAKIKQYSISGIISSHYDSALTLYEQLEKQRYHIPSTLALVCLKEDNYIGSSLPHISNMPIPYRDFASHVCRELIDACEKTELTDHHYLFIPECVLDTEDTIDVPTSFRKKKLVVVGSINMDITFNVNHLPQTGKTTSISNVNVAAGGKGLNQAVGVARMGHKVSLIGFIGNDTDSTFIFNLLEKEKVEYTGIQRDMDSQTGKAYIYIEDNGESAISILPGANNTLSSKAVLQQQHLFKNAGFCLISTEIPMEAAIETARVARTYGVKNILKPASVKSIPSELFQYTDFFIPNRKEATALSPSGLSVEEQAQFFYEKGIHTVIITLGHDGCYLKTENCSKYFPATDCVPVDSTGGADAFISSLASYLVEGYSLEQAIRIATYAAGLCVTKHSVVPALVDHSTMETYVKKIEPKLI